MLIQSFSFLRARQRIIFGPLRMIFRQESFLSMQNGWVVVVRVISVTRLAGHEVNRHGMAQRRMCIHQEIRVAQERNLELIRSEFNDIEFFAQIMLRRQNSENLIRFPCALPLIRQ